jgi:putative PIN family toxin of toxin-antitoxin system
MTGVVLDTNVLVSAAWSKDGNCARILSLTAQEILLPYYSQEIFEEYVSILKRPKFSFLSDDIMLLAQLVKDKGCCVTVNRSTVSFSDEDDRKFYDTACFCNARLITGNKKHYPRKVFIVSPAEFLEGFGGGGLS